MRPTTRRVMAIMGTLAVLLLAGCGTAPSSGGSKGSEAALGEESGRSLEDPQLLVVHASLAAASGGAAFRVRVLGPTGHDASNEWTH